MRLAVTIVLMLVFGQPAQADSPVPEAAKTVVEAYQADLAALERDHAKLVADAKNQHSQELDRLIEQAKNSGNLDDVLKLREERERVAKSAGPISETAPSKAKQARMTYDNAVRKAQAGFKLAADKLLESLQKEFTSLEKEETKAGRIESATQVREYSRTYKKGSASAPKITQAVSLPKNTPIDLLAKVKLPNHNLRGSWQVVTGGFSCAPSEHALLMLPVVVHDDYTLICEFTRRTSNGGVCLTIPVGLTSGAIVVGGWGEVASGIEILDGREGKDLDPSTGAVSRQGPVIVNGKKHRIEISVREMKGQATIRASLDGRPFVNWSGPARALSLYDSTVLPCAQAVGVETHVSVVDLHSVELTVNKNGVGYELGDDFQNPLTVVDKVPPKEIIKKCGQWNGRYYLISDKPMGFAAAQQFAAAYRGRLLTISSKEEDEFIQQQGRGLKLWMSGWRASESNIWRDERNRPLRYLGHWGPGNPELRYFESVIGLLTAATDQRGWHDIMIYDADLHACIEWGEE